MATKTTNRQSMAQFAAQSVPTPQAFLGLETAKAVELLSTMVAKYGPSVGKAVYEAWNGEKVVFVEILESQWGKGSFNIKLGFFNLIPHGVYIERWWAKSPEQLKFVVSIGEDQPGVSFDTGPKTLPAQTVRTQILLSNVDNPTNVWLDIPDASVPSNVDFVELRFEISRLDDPSPQELPLKIRLRGRP